MEYRGERSGENLGKIPHCRLERLRYRRKQHTLYSSEPRHRKAKNKEHRSRGKLKKAEFDFKIDLKTLIQQTLFYPKVRHKQKQKAHENLFPVFNEINKYFSLLYAGDEIEKPEDLKK